MDKKQHWENIYQTKLLHEVSWYQPTPALSLELIGKYAPQREARIIDIGGGDSFLADHLLNLGYTNITVLDISEAAINRARQRLGNRAAEVKWIVADASAFAPDGEYDLWHDRAAFHFLTSQPEVDHYVSAASKGLRQGGVLIVGTFSVNGPAKCSGIAIQQYSEASMAKAFGAGFQKTEGVITDHPTPFDTVQNFVTCVFKKV